MFAILFLIIFFIFRSPSRYNAPIVSADESQYLLLSFQGVLQLPLLTINGAYNVQKGNGGMS